MSNFGKTIIEFSSDIRVGNGYQDPRGVLLLQKFEMQIIHKHPIPKLAKRDELHSIGG